MDEAQYKGTHEQIECAASALANIRAILSDNDANTLGDLQRTAYKYADAGISVSFQTWHGKPIWNGSDQARDPAMIGAVKAIGFSSIIEGSDSKTALSWLDLTTIEDPAEAVRRYHRAVEETDAEGARLSDGS
jgi:hypothetical protein